MWHKVAWLFLWMTLAFWAGCAGENQNYKINEQDIDTFQEPPDGGPAQGGSVQATPSLDGLSRQHWEPITIGAVDGHVLHHPRYVGMTWGQQVFGSWRCETDRPSPLSATDDLKCEATAATSGGRFGWNGENLCDIVTNPAKFTLDLATLPGAVVVCPPCTIHQTP